MRFIPLSRSRTFYSLTFMTLIVIGIYAMSYRNLSYPSNFIRAFRSKSFDVHNHSHAYLRVRLNSTSNTAVCQAADILIIYILSTASNAQRRAVIRSTWASRLPGTCFVFILGRISNDTLVRREQREHQDIVLIDHAESYANVVYKEVAALHWSYSFYPRVPYLFKTDDDLIVDSILLSSIAHVLVSNSTNRTSYISKHRPALLSKMLSADRTNFFRGAWSMDYQPTVRDGGKFSISHDTWPHVTLPLYCSGFGWLMSAHVRDRLVRASHTYALSKVAWIGDVFVSGFLARAAQVNCTTLEIEHEQTGSGNCSCLMVKDPMLTVCSSTFHGGGSDEPSKYDEYRRAWKVIQRRHRSMNMTSNAYTQTC